MGFPGGAGGKEPRLPVQEPLKKTLGSIPGSGRFPWRRARQPTPVFLPRESHGQRSLAGYSPLDHKESGTAEATWHAHTCSSISSLLRAFVTRGCWILSCVFFFFLPCIEMIILFLTFMLLMWYITLIYLHMLSHFYISGINIPWLRCIILLRYCWIWFASILLSFFASKFMKIFASPLFPPL